MTPKDKDVVIDQPTCQFIPHALGMRQGQNLVAKNMPRWPITSTGPAIP